MNKLFTKAAALSVGLALAVGVGVAASRQSSVAKVKAADIALLSFSRSGTTDSYTQGATFTKSASAKTDYYQDNSSGTAYLQLLASSALTIPSDALSMTFKAVIGGGTADKDISSAPVKVSLLGSDGNALTGSVETLTSYITTKEGSEFTVDYSSFKSSTSIYGVKISHDKVASYNVRYYSFTLEYESASAIPTISLNKQEVTIGTEMTDSVAVTMQDLTANVTVSQTGSGSLNFESSISKDESSPFTFEFTGANAGDVELSFASTGAETKTLTVHVSESNVYTLVETKDVLTPGSTFIIVGDNGENHKVLSTTLTSNYYVGADVILDNDVAKTIFANELELEAAEQGMLIKSGNKYVGATKIDESTKLTTNANYASIAYPYWSFDIDETTHVATVSLVAETSGSTLLNFNPGYNRFSNYSTSQTPNLYVYAASLAPVVTVETSSVELEDNSGGVYSIETVNFGGEQVTLTATSNNTDVCTAAISNGQLEIHGVAPGQTTIVVEAQSANHGPVTFTVSVTITSATRILLSISVSVAEEYLYKGQEFSFSGVVTAHFDTGDEIIDDHSKLTFTGYNMSEVDDYSVTVSYTEKTRTCTTNYTLHVSQWIGPLNVGTYYVLASEYTVDEVDYKFAMVNMGTINSTSVGISAAYSTTLRSECALYVEAGDTYNSYAFKLANGKYVAAEDTNNLITSDWVEPVSSWTVVADGDNFTITNVAYYTRSIKYNSGNPRFATYASGQKPVTLKSVSYDNVANDFMINFMHTEIDINDNSDTGACRGESGYYALAKAAFNVMPAIAREHFLNSPIYTNYKARLEAWAAANGDEIDSESNLLVANASAINYYDSLTSNNNDVMVIVIVIAAVSAIALSTLLIIKKKKHN